jgi:hypothetical protein
MKKQPPDQVVTKYEQWAPLVICRNQIKNLKRNPRVISVAAKRKLKKIIETDGLLGPVNYNPKTGNVYGGNQRLALLDALEGRDDYFLTVAAAKKLSPERERKAAIYRLCLPMGRMTQNHGQRRELAGRSFTWAEFPEAHDDLRFRLIAELVVPLRLDLRSLQQ